MSPSIKIYNEKRPGSIVKRLTLEDCVTDPIKSVANKHKSLKQSSMFLIDSRLGSNRGVTFMKTCDVFIVVAECVNDDRKFLCITNGMRMGWIPSEYMTGV
jgi:hypothetical protein